MESAVILSSPKSLAPKAIPLKQWLKFESWRLSITALESLQFHNSGQKGSLSCFLGLYIHSFVNIQQILLLLSHKHILCVRQCAHHYGGHTKKF